MLFHTLLFHTTREALSYAIRHREETKKDVVIFETKTAYGVCFEKDFFVEMKTMIILVVYFHRYARALRGGVN